MKIGDGQPKSYNTSTRVVVEVNKQLWWFLNQNRCFQGRRLLTKISEGDTMNLNDSRGSLEEISTQNGPFNFYSISMSSCVSQ